MKLSSWALAGSLLAAAGLLTGSAPTPQQGTQSSQSTSSELAEMYRADQNDRKNMTTLGGETLMERDRKRLARVLELVAEEQLSEASDYYHAAMILQHSSPGSEGYKPEHYLLAHTLAVVAGFQGHEEARWLSAAALDRYFFWTDQEQFYGTQYKRDEDGRWQPGRASAYLTGALRREFGLPSQEEKQKRADSWN